MYFTKVRYILKGIHKGIPKYLLKKSLKYLLKNLLRGALEGIQGITLQRVPSNFSHAGHLNHTQQQTQQVHDATQAQTIMNKSTVK